MIWRNEEARNKAFGNDQANLSLSYTRQFPYDISLNVLTNIKMTHYNDFDTSVSSTKLRNDRERGITFTLAKKLTDSLNPNSRLPI